MKLWQAPAQPLPVRVRPFRGETVVSYTGRLATANELPRPTAVLRALGEPTRPFPPSLVTGYDVSLNAHALARLETFTAIPVQRLRKSLPSLGSPAAAVLPGDVPATRPYRCELRTPCERCAARRPGPAITVHAPLFPAVCTRHSRWIETSSDQPRQVDLTGTPQILAAHRRYARLRDAAHNNAWLREQLGHATRISLGWATGADHATRRLRERWTTRDLALGPAGGPPRPSALLVFPEAVTLVEIISDLPWRRHVAMVDAGDLATFYRLVAHRLGQPRAFANMIIYTPADPLRRWVALHRATHARTRTDLWQRHHRSRATATPFPEIRHFR